MSSPISYTNSKGNTSVYDPTAKKQKLCVADVKILVDKGFFPFGKKPNGQPYFNACGGVKRDNSQGKFKKGDKCDKCSMVFEREFSKATHYKSACIEAQKRKKRKKRDHTKKSEPVKVSKKLQARYERYANVFGEWALKKKGARRPAFNKNKDKVKELCDSKLGKIQIELIEVVAQSGINFKGAGQVGYTEPRVVKISLKDWFMKQYQLEGLELYPLKVKVEEDTSDAEDDFEVDMIDKRIAAETQKKNYIKKLCEDGRNLTSSERSAAIVYGFNVPSYISPFSQQWTVHPNRNPLYLSKVNAMEESKGYVSMYETTGMTVAEYWTN